MQNVLIGMCVTVLSSLWLRGGNVSKLDDMHSHMYVELWLRCFVCLRSVVMAPVSFVGPLHNSMSDESFSNNAYQLFRR